MSECIPVLGKVVAALIRKGVDRIDDKRANKRQDRVAARGAVTTEDAQQLAEMAARYCAQFFLEMVG